VEGRQLATNVVFRLAYRDGSGVEKVVDEVHLHVVAGTSHDWISG